LVLLRLGIGWHFYKEGSEKVQTGKFSSTGFLSNAKGPLAGFFKSFVRDHEGRYRLDRETTLDAWHNFRERAARHYGFDEKQQDAAEKAVKRREEQLKAFLGARDAEIQIYFDALEAREKEQADPVRQNVPSLKGQIGKKAVADLPPEPGPWFAEIEGLWNRVELDMYNLATDEQRQAGLLKLPRAGATTFGADQIDRVLPYFDLVIGICLILGLFTRVVAVAAAAFLCSVIATQWPGSYDAAPVYYQTIEMLGLLVLAATGAGRYAGLDYLISCCPCWNCCRGKKESANARKA
jgi:uncharacterized membrane protein YphA (DoxX/SURF4 family)